MGPPYMGPLLGLHNTGVYIRIMERNGKLLFKVGEWRLWLALPDRLGLL